jgi:lysyl-tRNA synthetase class 2
VTSSYPYRFDVTARAGELVRRFESLEPEQDAGATVRVAGRLRTVRTHGKVAFADLVDSTGRIQLFAQHAVIGDAGMEAFAALGVGDIVGAEGDVVRTKRGELSIRVTSVVLLAQCDRPMPDSWHGLADVEVRYRQRYLDLIVNPEARRSLEARALANSTIRSFLETRGFIEVETPLLQPIAGGAIARPFVTHHNSLDINLYLRVAPELYLKRLLIGGFEKVYELNRSFRNEGVSARHNPEFTMLEAYEAFADYNDTMTLVESLVRTIAESLGALTPEVGEEEIDLAAPFRRITMFEAIAEATGSELEGVWRSGDERKLRDAAGRLGVETSDSSSRGRIMLEVFENTTERSLTRPTFVAGFPKDVSPLARDHREMEGFTEHADLIIGGVEIAPIFSELNDPTEQRLRFEQQARARAAGEEDAQLPDEDFVEALHYGMPPAGGFGLGIDRLLTILLGLPSLREVILFPTLKPERP